MKKMEKLGASLVMKALNMGENLHDRGITSPLKARKIKDIGSVVVIFLIAGLCWIMHGLSCVVRFFVK